MRLRQKKQKYSTKYPYVNRFSFLEGMSHVLDLGATLSRLPRPASSLEESLETDAKAFLSDYKVLESDIKAISAGSFKISHKEEE